MTELIRIQEQEFTLHPLGTLFWQNQNTLLIADVYIDSDLHLKKYGTALTEDDVSITYENINEVIAYFNPEEIYFLGDVLQDSHSKASTLFEEWVATQAAHISIITKNYNPLLESYFEELGIEILDDFMSDDFFFTHKPTTAQQLFNICGHVHPGVQLKDENNQPIKYACFAVFEHQFILPSFGDLIGSFYINPNEVEAIFTCTEEEVTLV